MKVISAIGRRDPFHLDAEGLQCPGPVLGLCLHYEVDTIHILATDETSLNNISRLRQALYDRKIRTKIHEIFIDLEDPTDLNKVYKETKNIIQNFNKSLDLFVDISSGTPQIQTSLLIHALNCGFRPVQIIPPWKTDDGKTSIRTVEGCEEDYRLIDKSLNRQNHFHSAELESRENKNTNNNYRLGNVVTCSKKMSMLLKRIEPVIQFDEPLLILGEPGTGKTHISRQIHLISRRSERNFVHHNCADTGENISSSELFGHVRGAFTGALRDRKGIFSSANGGTLFLDEIGDLSLRVQAKILVAIEEGIIKPVGSDAVKKIDVRVIAATNQDLDKLVEKGMFRRDLYDRLNNFSFTLPPLRDRSEDIIHLAQQCLEKYNNKYGIEKTISDPVYRMMRELTWPGNIRQLDRFIVSLIAYSGTEKVINLNHYSIALEGLRDSHIRTYKINDPLFSKEFSLEDYIDDLRRIQVEKYLIKCGGVASKAARELGIQPARLNKWLREKWPELRNL